MKNYIIVQNKKYTENNVYELVLYGEGASPRSQKLLSKVVINNEKDFYLQCISCSYIGFPYNYLQICDENIDYLKKYKQIKM